MKYFIYCRKSTDSEERQVLSIEAQLAELKEFAAKEKLEIVASLCETKTAKEPGQTKFAEMLSLLEQKKQREFWLGIRIVLLVIRSTGERLFIYWTQEKSRT